MFKQTIAVCAAILLSACGLSSEKPVTAKGGLVDHAKCAEVQSELTLVLAKEHPTQLELQALIVQSADNCPNYEHSHVVKPICESHASACINTLEDELR